MTDQPVVIQGILSPPALGQVMGHVRQDQSFRILGISAEWQPCRRLLQEDIYDLPCGWKEVANDPHWVPREK